MAKDSGRFESIGLCVKAREYLKTGLGDKN
jgi:hypothetical protein